MKTFDINKKVSPARLHDALLAAGVAVMSVRDYGATGEATTSDDADNATVFAVIAAHDHAAADNLAQREDAVARLTRAEGECKVLRSAIRLMLDELNDLRTAFRDLKTNMATAANTVGGIKGAIAAIPALPNRTMVQAKTAMQSAINNGSNNGVD